MNTEPTIEQMDITIARFMGMEGSDDFIRQNYQYHKSWDLLMPVVHKVREMVFELRGAEKVANLYARLNAQLMYGTIADVHLRAYNLITWLNQQTLNNKSK